MAWILYILYIYIHSDILSDILSGILPVIYSDILLWIFLAYILTFFLASILAFYPPSILTFYLILSGFLSDILSCILSGIGSGILSCILSGIRSGILSDNILTFCLAFSLACARLQPPPQHPALAIWSSGPAALHCIVSIRSSLYGDRPAQRGGGDAELHDC